MNIIHLESKLTFEQLNITDSELNETMGYGTSLPDENVYAEMHDMLRQVAKMVVPRFEFILIEGLLNRENNSLQVGQTVFHLGRIIANQLQGAVQYAFFTATAGTEFESLQHSLKDEGDLVKCYMADCIGSIIAEKTADCMELALQEVINDYGWKHTNRFSPGYCGWHVSEQPSLFHFFPTPYPCGIHLTKSCLMVPIKSVSGIIGLGPDVRKLEYSCGLCSYEQCYKRKRKPTAK